MRRYVYAYRISLFSRVLIRNSKCNCFWQFLVFLFSVFNEYVELMRRLKLEHSSMCHRAHARVMRYVIEHTQDRRTLA